MSEQLLKTSYWLEYMNQKQVDDEMLHQAYLLDENVRLEIAESLVQIYEVADERHLQAYIHSQWAILARLVQYTSFLADVNMSEEELQHLMNKQLLLTAIYKMVVLDFQERFRKPPEVPAAVQRSPGFIRFLREQCGLQYVMHYIGFSLRAQMKESFGEDHPFLQDEEFFQQSLSYLLEMVIDLESNEELAETLQKQRDELIWLGEEMAMLKNEIALEPENERLKQELAQLEEDFALETLEHDFLQQVIEPIF